jgi:hypothetical protein
VVSAIETMHSVRKKLPRPRAEALVAFLHFGGYALASTSLAAFCARFLDFAHDQLARAFPVCGFAHVLFLGYVDPASPEVRRASP